MSLHAISIAIFKYKYVKHFFLFHVSLAFFDVFKIPNQNNRDLCMLGYKQ
jgi:hypothetical protein